MYQRCIPMKTILIPTDYSESANNAVEYGLSLAKVMPSRVVLYHAYHLPVPAVEMPYTFPPQEYRLDTEQSRLEEFARKLRNDNSKTAMTVCIASPGFAVDEIADKAEEWEADIVVMGVSHSGKIGHTLFGTVASGVMKKIRRPLLIVPEDAGFVLPTRIAFACDFEQEVSSTIIEKVRSFTALFHSKLMVINVENPGEPISNRKAVSSMQLDSELEGLNHSLHFPANKDIVAGLLEFDSHNLIDLLVMVPKPHSVLDQLLHTSKTRSMIFNTKVPVLVLHE
jgi:nucleotide-binding universal stress UspA family protein